MALFNVSGQSNAIVFGLTPSDLPSHLSGPMAAVQVWTGAGWQAFEPGVNTGTTANPDAWGWSAQFMHRWAADHPGQTAYVVNTFKGSTGVAADSSQDDWSPSTGEWFATNAANLAAAKASLASAGQMTHVDAILWNQGEQDAIDAAKASAYQTNLTNLISQARSAWGEASTAFIQAELSTTPGLAFDDDVRAAQVAVDAADGLVWTVDTDALVFQADQLHYSAADAVAMGNAYYDIFRNAARVFNGTSGADTITAEAGADSLAGGAGADWIFADANNDWLQGNQGADTLYGGSGTDTVIGGADNDVLRGGQGDDILEGANGSDLIFGDKGNDLVRGGAGADTFVIGTGTGQDTCDDFNYGDGDKVRIDGGLGYSVSHAGGDTVVSLSDGTSITLVGVTLSGFDWII